MYDVYIRFKYVKYDKSFEVVFDSRLSFKQNLYLLKNIYKVDNFIVFDPVKMIFLKTDVPLSSFNMTSLMLLELY